MSNIIVGNLPFDKSDLLDVERNLALGRFMTVYSQIETVWAFLFRKFCGMDANVGSVVFDNIDSKNQLTIVGQLVDYLPDAAEREAMKDLLNRVRGVVERRNKIMHGQWGVYNSEVARIYRNLTLDQLRATQADTPDGRDKRARWIHAVADLNKLVEECEPLRDQLLQALERIKPEPSPYQREAMERRAGFEKVRAQMVALHEASQAMSQQPSRPASDPLPDGSK